MPPLSRAVASAALIVVLIFSLASATSSSSSLSGTATTLSSTGPSQKKLRGSLQRIRRRALSSGPAVAPAASAATADSSLSRRREGGVWTSREEHDEREDEREDEKESRDESEDEGERPFLPSTVVYKEDKDDPDDYLSHAALWALVFALVVSPCAIYLARQRHAKRRAERKLLTSIYKDAQKAPDDSVPLLGLELLTLSARAPRQSKEKDKVKLIVVRDGSGSLDVDEEIREIRAALKEASHIEADVEVCEVGFLGATLEAIEKPFSCRIWLHLAGHGSRSGHFSTAVSGEEIIAAESTASLQALVSAYVPRPAKKHEGGSNFFARPPSQESGGLELVFVNSCHSASVVHALRVAKVPCALGWASACSDIGARKFSAAFYRACGAGAHPSTAYAFAKHALLKPVAPAVAFQSSLATSASSSKKKWKLPVYRAGGATSDRHMIRADYVEVRESVHVSSQMSMAAPAPFAMIAHPSSFEDGSFHEVLAPRYAFVDPDDSDAVDLTTGRQRVLHADHPFLDVSQSGFEENKNDGSTPTEMLDFLIGCLDDDADDKKQNLVDDGAPIDVDLDDGGDYDDEEQGCLSPTSRDTDMSSSSESFLTSGAGHNHHSPSHASRQQQLHQMQEQVQEHVRQQLQMQLSSSSSYYNYATSSQMQQYQQQQQYEHQQQQQYAQQQRHQYHQQQQQYEQQQQQQQQQQRHHFPVSSSDCSAPQSDEDEASKVPPDSSAGSSPASVSSSSKKRCLPATGEEEPSGRPSESSEVSASSSSENKQQRCRWAPTGRLTLRGRTRMLDEEDCARTYDVVARPPDASDVATAPPTFAGPLALGVPLLLADRRIWRKREPRPLDSATIPYLGVKKVARLASLGVKTVEDLAHVNPRDRIFAVAATNNLRADRACRTLSEWRDKAKLLLLEEEEG